MNFPRFHFYVKAMNYVKRLLFFGLMLSALHVSSVRAEEKVPRTLAEKIRLAEKLRLIDSIPDQPFAYEVRILLNLCGDKSIIPDPSLIPAEPLRVSGAAAAKLASLSHLPATADIALDYLESNNVSLFQFTAILRAFRFHSISDADAVRLQDFAARRGVEFDRAIAVRISMSPQKVHEHFDLLITNLLYSRSSESIIPACKAIMKRSTRVLLWNTRLVDLCNVPLDDYGYDARNLVMEVLRVNGFPDSDTAEFLREFRPERETELYWQHKATKYTVLGDAEFLEEILKALSSPEFREFAAKAMSRNLHIPERYKIEVYDAAAVQDDLASAYLARSFMENFSASGMTDEELERLKRRATSKKDFKAWRDGTRND